MNAWPVYRDGRVEYTMTSHQRLAIRAAQAGNWKPADSLEIDRLCREVHPHDGDGGLCEFPNLEPTEILRGAGPHGEDLVEWRFALRCPACDGSGEKAGSTFSWADDGKDCWRCDGDGIDPDERGVLITDLDGLIIEDRLP